jgi:membrane protein required for colicin V production
VNTLAALGWVDLSLLAVLALSVVVGLWRGLVFELMSLIGWVVAYIAAQAWSPLLAPRLPIGTPGSALQQGAAFALTFLAALIAWAVLARLLRLLVHATPLTFIDRVLGAGFGLLRGAVLLLAVSTVVAFTPAMHSQAWQDSKGAAWLGAALQGLKPMLPEDVSRHLPA